jgi:hypothetical protein
VCVCVFGAPPCPPVVVVVVVVVVGGRKRCILDLIRTPKTTKNMKIGFSVEIHSKWSGF